MRPRFRAMWIAIAAVALLGLATALTEAWFFHTDDGCAVEIHCIACRWTSASTGVATALHAPSVTLPLAGPITPQPAVPHVGSTPDVRWARGPPPA